MVKIDKLIRDKGVNATVKERIRRYLKENKDEVLQYNSAELKTIFPDCNVNSINWGLWILQKTGEISKIKIGRNVYFGSSEAIEELKRSL